jgi:ribosomal protein S18 acetylase RimI-like enzyme
MQNIDIVECDFSNPMHGDKLFELLNMYITDEMGGGIAIREEKKEKLLYDLDQHPSKLILFAVYKGEYLGFTNCFINYSTFKLKPYVYIHDIAVSPMARGKGLGKALLEAITQRALEMGCCKVTLEVRDDNEVAQNAYKSMGWGDCDPVMHYWEKPL